MGFFLNEILRSIDRIGNKHIGTPNMKTKLLSNTYTSVLSILIQTRDNLRKRRGGMKQIRFVVHLYDRLFLQY
jgi:hypothetical protein